MQSASTLDEQRSMSKNGMLSYVQCILVCVRKCQFKTCYDTLSCVEAFPRQKLKFRHIAIGIRDTRARRKNDLWSRGLAPCAITMGYWGLCWIGVGEQGALEKEYGPWGRTIKVVSETGKCVTVVLLA